MTNGQKIYSFIKTLFPINRSITGNGVRETLSVISDIIPLSITEVPSGTKVFDWEIPLEWNIEDAWVKNSKGEKIIDFNESNLSVLNYSIPIDMKVSFNELKDHLYTLPDFPDWIPYRTSYHNQNWGFCLPHRQLASMKNENYHVRIDSSLRPGSLTYGEYLIKGETDNEILISTHVCHPSLANDNLSGIALSTFLAESISNTNLYYSYRFLFVPSTIGSIAWLFNNESILKKIVNGLVITLLGDHSDFHYKKSRQGNAEIDNIIEYILEKRNKPFKLIDFYPYGYDERQYCSPGFNLPVGRLSRKPHGEFPEYHTSADNLEFIKPEKLSESLDLLKSIVTTIEKNKVYLNLNPKCEPQLGKRGLYKNVGGQSKSKLNQMALLWVLNLSDGKNSLLDIAKRSGISFNDIYDAAQKLNEAGLLSQMEDRIR